MRADRVAGSRAASSSRNGSHCALIAPDGVISSSKPATAGR